MEEITQSQKIMVIVELLLREFDYDFEDMIRFLYDNR